MASTFKFTSGGSYDPNSSSPVLIEEAGFEQGPEGELITTRIYYWLTNKFDYTTSTKILYADGKFKLDPYHGGGTTLSRSDQSAPTYSATAINPSTAGLYAQNGTTRAVEFQGGGVIRVGSATLGGITGGTGTGLAAYGVQVGTASGGFTPLYIDLDGNGGTADLTIQLAGSFSTANLRVSSNEISAFTPVSTDTGGGGGGNGGATTRTVDGVTVQQTTRFGRNHGTARWDLSAQSGRSRRDGGQPRPAPSRV